jgi:hypothetical protein
VTFGPDEQAQAVIRLIFEAFDRQGAVRGVPRYLIAHGIKPPIRPRAGADRGQLQWHPPCRGTVRHILRHPTYAGAYRYGYRPTDARRRAPAAPRAAAALGHAPSTTAADRRQIARLLLERVVLTVDPASGVAGIRVEWAGGAVREQAIRRAVRSYHDQGDWPRLSARRAALYRRGQTPPRTAAALGQDGFRPPKRSTRFTAGVVRRLLDELGSRPRAPRCTSSGNLPAAGERWLSELASLPGVSPYTPHGWRGKGWLHARRVGGRGSPWAVWVSGEELARPRQLQACPRLWTNRERLAERRAPMPQP